MQLDCNVIDYGGSLNLRPNWKTKKHTKKHLIK